MKTMKRSLSVLLAMLMLLSAFSFAVSAEDENRIVAIMYHCVSGIHSPYAFGHSWICISNAGDEPLTVGPETIEPGAMISVGLHSAKGRVFNREMREFKNSFVTALQREMTIDDLKKAENEIMKSKWTYYELFGHNCTNFSSAVWKAVTGQKFTPFIFPVAIKNQFPKGQKIKIFIE